MTVWSDNANHFATTQKDAEVASRHAGVREAIAQLVEHNDRAVARLAAYDRLVAAVEQQARILGVGQVTIPTRVVAA